MRPLNSSVTPTRASVDEHPDQRDGQQPHPGQHAAVVPGGHDHQHEQQHDELHRVPRPVGAHLAAPDHPEHHRRHPGEPPRPQRVPHHEHQRQGADHSDQQRDRPRHGTGVRGRRHGQANASPSMISGSARHSHAIRRGRRSGGAGAGSSPVATARTRSRTRCCSAVGSAIAGRLRPAGAGCRDTAVAIKPPSGVSGPAAGPAGGATGRAGHRCVAAAGRGGLLAEMTATGGGPGAFRD